MQMEKHNFGSVNHGEGPNENSGSGTFISVWSDHWILDVWPRPAKRKWDNYLSNLMVNHMINPMTKEWNINILNDFFFTRMTF